MRKKNVVIGVLILLGLLALAVSDAVVNMNMKNVREQNALAFDSTAWKRAVNANLDSTRYHMLGDLTSKHRLVGMSKEQVLDLLGPQTDTDKFRDWDLRYVVAPDGIDFLWLLIKFNADRVVKVDVVSD